MFVRTDRRGYAPLSVGMRSIHHISSAMLSEIEVMNAGPVYYTDFISTQANLRKFREYVRTGTNCAVCRNENTEELFGDDVRAVLLQALLRISFKNK
ncbi:hypothetical protein EVAR_67300_1 [Eumeta japonica]|uniref:Uncharacterized protein n=1 Tax=Eumeta variegata TaxID=151549 RepID=A0A4C2A9R5_EUMVA|nr:hypothetical protein EVAR_67300_1 [Eumeta japonica]